MQANPADGLIIAQTGLWLLGVVAGEEDREIVVVKNSSAWRIYAARKPAKRVPHNGGVSRDCDLLCAACTGWDARDRVNGKCGWCDRRDWVVDTVDHYPMDQVARLGVVDLMKRIRIGVNSRAELWLQLNPQPNLSASWELSIVHLCIEQVSYAS